LWLHHWVAGDYTGISWHGWLAAVWIIVTAVEFVFFLYNDNFFDPTDLFHSVTVVIIVYLNFNYMLFRNFKILAWWLALTAEHTEARLTAISVRAFPNDNAENDE
jgi:hypothetical protein